MRLPINTQIDPIILRVKCFRCIGTCFSVDRSIRSLSFFFFLKQEIKQKRNKRERSYDLSKWMDKVKCASFWEFFSPSYRPADRAGQFTPRSTCARNRSDARRFSESNKTDLEQRRIFPIICRASYITTNMTELAKEAFASRNYRLAVEMYERSLKQQAPSFEVLVGYGDSLAKCGRIRESIGVYSRCLSEGSVLPERLKHLANALLDELSGTAITATGFRKKIETSFACPLCEGILCQPVTTNCGHTYCKNCVEPGKSCRVCGQKIVAVSETNVLVQRLVEKWWPREAEASRARHEGDILMKEGHLGQALERYNLAVHLGEYFFRNFLRLESRLSLYEVTFSLFFISLFVTLFA